MTPLIHAKISTCSPVSLELGWYGQIQRPLTLTRITVKPDGGWLNGHSIPSDRSNYGSFSVLQDSNRKIILDVLQGNDESPSKDDSPVELAEKQNLLKLRTGYRTCMDEVSGPPGFGLQCGRRMSDSTMKPVIRVVSILSTKEG